MQVQVLVLGTTNSGLSQLIAHYLKQKCWVSKVYSAGINPGTGLSENFLGLCATYDLDISKSHPTHLSHFYNTPIMLLVNCGIAPSQQVTQLSAQHRLDVPSYILHMDVENKKTFSELINKIDDFCVNFIKEYELE